jgi:hypothetical protein
MHTMKRFTLLAVFLTATQSIAMGPEQIKSNFENALRPYFQNARIILQPEHHVVFGFACIEGAGPQLANQAAQAMEQQLGPNGLMTSVERTFLAAYGYTSIVVGFDNYFAVFNIQTRQAWSKPVSDPGYQQMYRRECNLGAR